MAIQFGFSYYVKCHCTGKLWCLMYRFNEENTSGISMLKMNTHNIKFAKSLWSEWKYATILVVDMAQMKGSYTVYPKKYAHGFVVLCFVVVMQSFIMNSHEVFIHIHQGCFAATGAIVRLPQCQWSKPDGYGKISQCITTTKHSKAKTVCIFLCTSMAKW